jgi:hypothetical protein
MSTLTVEKPAYLLDHDWELEPYRLALLEHHADPTSTRSVAISAIPTVIDRGGPNHGRRAGLGAGSLAVKYVRRGVRVNAAITDEIPHVDGGQPSGHRGPGLPLPERVIANSDPAASTRHCRYESHETLEARRLRSSASQRRRRSQRRRAEARSALTRRSAGLPALATGALEASRQGRAELRTGVEIAVWTFESVLDQPLCSLCVHDASVKLRNLALGQMDPVSTSPAPGGQQPTDLPERKAGVLAEANESDTRCARLRVPPSLADPFGR